MADESQYKGKILTKYYLSSKALGQLFRDIDLPGEQVDNAVPFSRARLITSCQLSNPLEPHPPARRSRRKRRARNAARLSQAASIVARADTYTDKVNVLVRHWLGPNPNVPTAVQDAMRDYYDHYSLELNRILYAYRLTDNALQEAEVFIGALAAPRKGKKRRIMLASVNKEIVYLLDITRRELEPVEPAGTDAATWERALLGCYAAWTLSLDKLNEVGACSFNLIAFEALLRCAEKLQ